MSDQRNGGIVWTEQTWNPLRGCSRVSAGCVNCYAEKMAARFCSEGQPYEGTINPETKRWSGKIKLVHEKLTEPLRWKRPRMVFVNSMSDLFHENVPDEFLPEVFAVMAMAKQHTFQVLTKRPERMHEVLNDGIFFEAVEQTVKAMGGALDDESWPLPNVWLGVTAENQEAADERIPLLLQTPAAVHWVSVEPMVGAVDISRWLAPSGVHCMDVCPDTNYVKSDEIETYKSGGEVIPRCPRCGESASWTGYDEGIDWVVCGGESGSNARPMHPDWARSLRDQCAEAGVPFLFKQWGEWCPRGPESFGYPSVEGVPRLRMTNTGEDGQDLSANGGNDVWMNRAGKKHAGRLLGGVLHNAFPVWKP